MRAQRDLLVDSEQAKQHPDVDEGDEVAAEGLHRDVLRLLQPLLQAAAVLPRVLAAHRRAPPSPSSLANSSARIGTPRLQACTPCATQSFSTSMISATLAPRRSPDV